MRSRAPASGRLQSAYSPRLKCLSSRTTARVRQMSTPDLQLRTAFVLSAQGRIVSTREPGATRGPLFCIVRGARSCACAVRADVPEDIACELERLARDEPPSRDLRAPP